jgi:AcrR family transcriptional regulator
VGLQDERREQTRARLLEATVRCLVERGFANLTTAEVAQRAGVSKGAQLYHFPTKDDLVVAALKHLFQARGEALHRIIARSPHDIGARMSAMIDELWQAYRGDTFFAWLELVVASRTDLALRNGMLDVNLRLSVDLSRLWQEAFPEIEADLDAFKALSHLVNGQLASLSLFTLLDDTRETPDVDAALAMVKDLGRHMLEQMRAASTGRPLAEARAAART